MPGSGRGLTLVLAGVLTVLPRIAAWWTGRRVLRWRDDPALAERQGKEEELGSLDKQKGSRIWWVRRVEVVADGGSSSGSDSRVPR